MAKKRPQNHVHKYILKVMQPSGYKVYMCALEDCSHYIEAMLAQGKQSICWRCGEVCYVALTRTGREIKRPHCLTCVKVYNKRDVAGKPVIDVKKIAEMSWDDLLGGDQRFVPNSKKKKDED